MTQIKENIDFGDPKREKSQKLQAVFCKKNDIFHQAYSRLFLIKISERSKYGKIKFNVSQTRPASVISIYPRQH